MARADLGVRVEKVATKEVRNGRPTVEENIVGWANKSQGLGVFDDPSDPSVKLIAVGESCILMVGGKHELPVGNGAGNNAPTAPAATAVGDKLWIKPSNNAIYRNTPNADGDLPLGVVEEIDTARTPDVVLVNTNSLAAFLAADVA